VYKLIDAAEKKKKVDIFWYFKGKLCRNEQHISYAHELNICKWTI